MAKKTRTVLGHYQYEVLIGLQHCQLPLSLNDDVCDRLFPPVCHNKNMRWALLIALEGKHLIVFDKCRELIVSIDNEKIEAIKPQAAAKKLQFVNAFIDGWRLPTFSQKYFCEWQIRIEVN